MGVVNAARRAIEDVVVRTHTQTGQMEGEGTPRTFFFRNPIANETWTQVLWGFDLPPKPERETLRNLGIPGLEGIESLTVDFVEGLANDDLRSVVADAMRGEVLAAMGDSVFLDGIDIRYREHRYWIQADILWGETFLSTMAEGANMLVGVLSARVRVPYNRTEEGWGDLYEVADEWRARYTRHSRDLTELDTNLTAGNRITFRAASGPQPIILPDERSLDPLDAYVVNIPFDVDEYP